MGQDLHDGDEAGVVQAREDSPSVAASIVFILLCESIWVISKLFCNIPESSYWLLMIHDKNGSEIGGQLREAQYSAWGREDLQY
jgi:hypothetical protein